MPTEPHPVVRAAAEALAEKFAQSDPDLELFVAEGEEGVYLVHPPTAEEVAAVAAPAVLRWVADQLGSTEEVQPLYRWADEIERGLQEGDTRDG